MRRFVLGTAGHIDHGKTALVRALTGTDTDRLPEEKRRGITIDLGFASLDFPDGTGFSIVDVPGHEAFIRNMVAGASGIDLVLLVIAADEGVMPQTREHLAIVELLGVERGVVALTKTDLVDEDWLELVREDVRGALAETPLVDAAVVGVSARTGTGLDELLAALRAASARIPGGNDDDLFRMPIDRVFTVRGTGTVVTGTVWSGRVQRDSQVRLLPADVTVRVRAVQQHGRESDVAMAGSRAAIALTGVDRHMIGRGDTLVASPAWSAAGILTVDLEVVRDAAAPVRPRQRVRVHAGTAEVIGRIGMSSEATPAGGHALVQLRLESPVVARAGDRVVIRSYSPVHTIAGGRVLEPVASKRRRVSDDAAAALNALVGALTGGRDAVTPDRAAAAVTAAVALQGPGGATVAALPLLCGLQPSLVRATLESLTDSGTLVTTGERVLDGQCVRHVEEAILRHTAAFHAEHTSRDGVEREAVRRALAAATADLFDVSLDRLVATGRLTVTGALLALPGHSARLSPDAQHALERLAGIYAAAALQAPDLAELPPDLAARRDLASLLRLLERDGRVLRLSATRWISAQAVADGIAAIAAHLPSGQPLEVSDFKQVVNLTRKHLIPFLEHLDRIGVTRRDGGSRVLS